MKKQYCDLCESDMANASGYFRSIGIPCHVAEERDAYCMSFNNQFASVSGRSVDYDLCPICSDELYKGIFKLICDLKQKNSLSS